MASRTLYLPVMVVAAAAVACLVAMSAISQKAEAAFPGKNGKIAYQGSDRIIYTIHPDGGGKTKVTNNHMEAYAPSFSADSKKIAYTGWDGNDSEIYTIKAARGRPFQVTDNATNDNGPSFSPNGKRIAYACSDGNDSEICTINARRKGKRFQLTNNDGADHSPSYSPSAKG